MFKEERRIKVWGFAQKDDFAFPEECDRLEQERERAVELHNQALRRYVRQLLTLQHRSSSAPSRGFPPLEPEAPEPPRLPPVPGKPQPLDAGIRSWLKKEAAARKLERELEQVDTGLREATGRLKRQVAAAKQLETVLEEELSESEARRLTAAREALRSASEAHEEATGQEDAAMRSLVQAEEQLASAQQALEAARSRQGEAGSELSSDLPDDPETASLAAAREALQLQLSSAEQVREKLDRSAGASTERLREAAASLWEEEMLPEYLRRGICAACGSRPRERGATCRTCTEEDLRAAANDPRPLGNRPEARTLVGRLPWRRALATAQRLDEKLAPARAQVEVRTAELAEATEVVLTLTEKLQVQESALRKHVAKLEKGAVAALTREVRQREKALAGARELSKSARAGRVRCARALARRQRSLEGLRPPAIRDALARIAHEEERLEAERSRKKQITQDLRVAQQELQLAEPAYPRIALTRGTVVLARLTRTTWLARIAEQNETPRRVSRGEDADIWLFRGRWYSAEAGLADREVTLLIEETRRRRGARLDGARLRANGSAREPIAPDVITLVWQRDGGRCVRCGSEERLELDHLIPISLGGSGTARNLQLLCESCGLTKSAAT